MTVTLDRMIHAKAVHQELGKELGIEGCCVSGCAGGDINPIDMLAMSLASCLVIVMAKGGQTKGIDLSGTWADVDYELKHYTISSISVRIYSPHKPSEGDRTFLETESHGCPVYLAVKDGVKVNVAFEWGSSAVPKPASATQTCCGGAAPSKSESCCAGDAASKSTSQEPCCCNDASQAKSQTTCCADASAAANAAGAAPRARARYVMIGGFLGAGKTSAIIKFAEHLKSRGRRVGLISNDQSVDLVDSARARAAGFAVEEITGGCFCCKFDSLMEASKVLTRQTAPDVLVAEPVGSCTDLQATVSYPLRQLYGDLYRVAPLSVLVDPQRCGRILGLFQNGRSFSEKVVYVYRKQLEEAEILVINKVDLLDASQRQMLAAELRVQYPRAKVIEVSTTTGEGMEAWFEMLLSEELGHRQPMDLDYDIYADGEALLGWLNAKAEIQAPEEFDGNAFLVDLSVQLRDRLALENIEIAHLKMTLAPDTGPDLGAISLTRTQDQPHATHRLTDPLSRGTLVINLRAEADPELLKDHVSKAIAQLPGVKAAIQVLAAFRPCRPSPTHRMAEAL